MSSNMGKVGSQASKLLSYIGQAESITSGKLSETASLKASQRSTAFAPRAHGLVQMRLRDFEADPSPLSRNNRLHLKMPAASLSAPPKPARTFLSNPLIFSKHNDLQTVQKDFFGLLSSESQNVQVEPEVVDGKLLAYKVKLNVTNSTPMGSLSTALKNFIEKKQDLEKAKETVMQVEKIDSGRVRSNLVPAPGSARAPSRLVGPYSTSSSSVSSSDVVNLLKSQANTNSQMSLAEEHIYDEPVLPARNQSRRDSRLHQRVKLLTGSFKNKKKSPVGKLRVIKDQIRSLGSAIKVRAQSAGETIRNKIRRNRLGDK